MVQVINRWNELAGKVKPSTLKGLKAVAAAAQSNIRSFAPKETGWMADNIYVSAPDESDYGSGGSPPNDDVSLLEEAKPESDMQVNVGAAASYSIFVNDGHRTRSGSFVPANPFFDQGVAQTAGDFEQIMRDAIAEGLA